MSNEYPDSITKIEATMRNVYRLQTLQSKTGVPDILIEMELESLKKKFSQLTYLELIYIIQQFHHYAESQKLKDAIGDEMFAKGFSAYLASLN